MGGVCGGVRVQGIRGVILGISKPLIWKHLTDWHFILQPTMASRTMRYVKYPSLPPSVLAVVYAVVRYAELNCMLTNHPPPPRYIHTVSDKLNLCSTHSHYSPLTQIVEAQQFYISPPSH